MYILLHEQFKSMTDNCTLKVFEEYVQYKYLQYLTKLREHIKFEQFQYGGLVWLSPLKKNSNWFKPSPGQVTIITNVRR